MSLEAVFEVAVMALIFGLILFIRLALWSLALRLAMDSSLAYTPFYCFAYLVYYRF